MKNRLVIAASAVALSALALLGAAPAFAQESSGGTINIGGSIADTVAGAVSGIATGGGSASGGTSVEHTEASFGEDEGVAISDASGGNHNLSAKSK